MASCRRTRRRGSFPKPETVMVPPGPDRPGTLLPHVNTSGSGESLPQLETSAWERWRCRRNREIPGPTAHKARTGTSEVVLGVSQLELFPSQRDLTAFHETITSPSVVSLPSDAHGPVMWDRGRP